LQKKSGLDNKYQALPANHKTVLQLMSVLYTPTPINDLYLLLKKMNLGKNNGVYFTPQEIQQIIQFFIKNGIINHSNQIIKPDFLHDATKEALKRQTIKNSIHILQTDYPELENNKINPNRTIRDFRINLFQNKSFRSIDANNPENNGVMIAPLLNKIKNHITIDINWSKMLSAGYQPFILNILITRGLNKLIDIHKLIDLAIDTKTNIKTDTQINKHNSLLITEYELAQADSFALSHFLKKSNIDSNFNDLISNIIEIINSKDNTKKISANSKKFINKLDSDSCNNLFYILGIFILIQEQQDIKEDSVASKNLEILFKKLKKVSKNPHRFEATIKQLMQLTQHLLRQRGVYPDTPLKAMALDINSKADNIKTLEADHLLSQLISLAITPNISEDQITHFHNQFDLLEQNGYLFYCGLIEQTLRTQESKAHIPSFKKPLQTKLGWANPIIPNMIGTKISTQTKQRESLVPRSLLAGAMAPQKKIKRRIIWYFNEQNNELTAIEQKESAKGWSKGRNISENEITNHKAHFPYLDKIDMDICEALKPNKSINLIKTNNRYAWDQDLLLEALINHPRIYHNRYKTVKLNFHKSSPEIYLNSINKLDKLDNSSSVSLKKIDEQNFDIMFPQDKIQETYQELIQKPDTDKLFELIKNNATCFSDTHLENIEIINADETIHLLLTPNSKNAIDISIKVKPDLLNKNLYIEPGTKAKFIIGNKNVLNLEAEQKPELVQYRRNLEKEISLAKLLISSCSVLTDSMPDNIKDNIKDNINYNFHLDSPHQCLELLSELNVITNPKIKISWPQGEIRRIKGSASINNLSIKLTQKGHWFQAEGEVKIDENTKISLTQLLAKISEQNGNFIELAPGEFIELNKHFKQKLEQIALVSNSSEEEINISAQHVHAFDSITEDMENIETDDQWQKQLEKFTKPTPKLALDKLNITLRPYQEEGIQWLNKLSHWGFGACLADDMGLGKTIQTIAILSDRAEKGPQLVIAPTSVCYNWQKEINKIAPELNAYILSEHPREQLLKTAGSCDIIIASYGLLQHAGELIKKTHWTSTILDEAQAIKNSKTKRAKMAFELQSDCRICLSGTPIENHLHELWSLFQFLNPGFLGNYNHFSKKYIKPIEHDKDSQSINVLKKIIQPYILRRHKSEVLKDLPQKTEQVIDIELTDEEMVFYENLRENALNEINKVATNDNETPHAGHRRMHILSEITKLRQACCHPAIIEPQIQMPSSKLEKLEQMLEELLENNHKVLIFSQFVSYLQHVQTSLTKNNIDYHYLDGSTPQSQRKESVEAFQNGEKSVFLLSLKAGGVGLNLTQADYVIILDPWWNPAVENQAADRAHRIGQTRPVTLYRLICKNTIEEKIIALHQKKRDLSDSLLSGTQKSGGLSEKELLNLIQAE
jgi:SNF2 family DNA or RNA helicase